MDEFKNQGGSLGGRGERSDAFTGEPKHVGGALSGAHSSSHSNNGVSESHNSSGVDSHGKPSLGQKLNPKVDADGDGKAGVMS